MPTPSPTDLERDTGRPSGHRRPASLRSLLVLVALLPLLGMVTLATLSATDRWSAREAAQSLADQTERLDRLVEARAAVAEERAYSGALALSSTFGLDVDEFEVVSGADLDALLTEARATVDDITLPRRREALEDSRSGLAEIRQRVDQGEAGYADVTEAFQPLDDLFDETIDGQLEAIIDTAADSRLPGHITERIDALQASLDAFAQGGPLGRFGTQVFLGTELVPELLTPESVIGLVEAISRFDTAVAEATAHTDLPAADAWQEFLDDPAAQRTQQGYDTAARLGLGVAEQESPGPELLINAFDDANRWSDLVSQALQTASADLRNVAQEQVREETESMAWRLGGTVLLTAIALIVAVRIARGVTRPVGHIADAANQVHRGELDIDRIEPSGPREVASTAVAFNDMAITLTEVERRAIALTETPDDPSLATPLPGRVGQALQGALDRLRVSIRLAEERRAELERVATHDGLTGLLNRTAALDALARELAQARRDGAAAFALFIDLDGLKPINDTHGHDAGDDAIRLTADALRSQTRDADVVARLGGDEFLVAGRVDQGSAHVEGLADRIVAAVGAQSVRVIDGEIPLRASAGIATTVPGADAESVDELVQRADTALYAAKRAGGSRSSWGPTVANGDRDQSNP